MSESGGGEGGQVLGRAPLGACPEGCSDVSLLTPPRRLDYVMASWGRDLLPCGEGRIVYVCMPAPLWEEHADREEFPGLSSQCPGQLPHPCPKCLLSLASLLWG